MPEPEDPNSSAHKNSTDPQPGSSPATPSSPASIDETLLTSSSSPDSAYGAIPKTIGPYRLIRKLGEGGMGQVWLAEQTSPLQRLVAIKLIRAGLSDSVLIERFESERQALARMNHPAIAKVFEAGATPEGIPYFVMEYVPGVPITLYCDQKRLSIRERLALFLEVCDGVQHAHQKAVIHRDLKPANILVTEIDGKPTPRIIDFGIAKALSEGDALATMVTRAGVFVGTPAYMSPEQADPDVQDVDTRTDVYSLAVILYELLTGSLPFDPTQWRAEVIRESLRRLREVDPPLPSIQFNKKATTEHKTATHTADLRSTGPQQLVSLLRGDLDWIAMKALEKDRARRYGTPNELAADLQHFLNHEPVTARPASAAYRIQKYVRRHRVAVSVASAGVALLIVFAILQAVQIRRVTQERDRTARERDRASRVTDFMTRMFKVSDPSESRGNSITAREVLDKASKDIDTGLRQDPELQAQLMAAMGHVYFSLGLYSQAESLDRQALDIRTRTLGPNNRDTIASMRALSIVLQDQTKFPESEQLARAALQRSRKSFGPSDLEALKDAGQLGDLLRDAGRYSDAEAVFLQALHDAAGTKDTATSLLLQQDLAICYAYQAKFAQAEESFRRVFELDRKSKGDDHPEVLNDLNNIGNILSQEQKYTESETVYRQVLDSKRRILGPEHPSTVLTMGNLALVLTIQKRYSEAEPLFRQALEIKTRTLGPDNRSTLVTQGNLVDTLKMEGRYSEAEKLSRATFAAERRVLGPEHSDTLANMNVLADILANEHHYAESEALYRQTIALRIKVLTAHHPDTAVTECSLTHVLAMQGKRDEAFTHFQLCLDDGPRPSDLTDQLSGDSLNALRSDPRFAPLAARAKQIISASKTP